MPIHGITATYQPFSFQERLAPLQMMKEEYDKVNESLALYDEQANQYYQFLDDNSKAIVDQYKNTLSRVAGDMASSGLKAVNRNTLNSLRRVYANDILPIQQAAQTAGTMYAQIREMQMKDPTLIVQSIPTVSELRQNPMASPSLVSGVKLQADGADAAMQLQGVSYDQIARYLNGDTSAIPELSTAAQRIADNYGVSSNQAMGYIVNGIMNGLGTRATQIDITKQKADIEFDKQMRLARYNQGAQTARQNAQIAASREARNAEMLLRGYVPDGKGGYVFDENAALNTQASAMATAKPSSRTGQSSGRTTTQYQNRTRGIIKYDGNGQVTESGNNVSLAGGTQIADITKATTEEKVAALRHAGIPIGNAQATDASGNFSGTYNKEAIDALINEYIDELSAYRFYSSKDRRGRLKSFWGAGTDVKRDVDGTSSSGYYNPSASMSSSENEIPEEDQ